MPTNAGRVYARLWSNFNGVWAHVDYTFTAAGPPAALNSPTPGSSFAGPEVTFTWTPVAGVTQYGLWVGTAGAGSNNLYDSGPTTATSVTTRNMPTDAGRVYARLWSIFNGVWAHVDYTFTAAGPPAALISPTPGSTCAEPEVTFTWTPVAGVTQYGLWVGTAGVGSNNLYDSGPTTATSVTTRSMPTNAGRVYARLWSNFNGVRAYVDYTFTAAGPPAALISPRSEEHTSELQSRQYLVC